MRKIRTTAARRPANAIGRRPQMRPGMLVETRQALVYSTAKWQAIRAEFKRVGWTFCCCCKIRAADVLDHIIPIQINRAIAFDIRNLQPLCNQCHNAKTERIDAPSSDSTRYRHDLAHTADMRPDSIRGWAELMVRHGHARRWLGSFEAGTPMPRRGSRC